MRTDSKFWVPKVVASARLIKKKKKIGLIVNCDFDKFF